ncbi:hypothetical protein OG709_30115 [Streptomyces sp. NBC_01267]|uniref:hypothetical protein n=1 Tax=Streptomyces sp. NBC_01267 TaxID=2903805 RepID=UPI002E36374F|nr:hypothetical protein [Streptomyces sp. NBC_01267]
MTDTRFIEYSDTEGIRWSRVIAGVLYVFDYVRPWTAGRERHAGRLMVDRVNAHTGEWGTVRYTHIPA